MKKNIILKPAGNVRRKARRLWHYHLYYKRSGLYTFLLKNMFKLFILIGSIMAALLFVQHYVIDFEVLFNQTIGDWNKYAIYGAFYFSESIIGFLPNDLFIAWTAHADYPLLALTVLATLSYLGGINAYWLGRLLRESPKMQYYLRERFVKQAGFVRKWGTVFIIIAALFPVPFPATSTAAGLVRFPFKKYVIIALARFLRYYGFASFIFQMV